MGFSLGGIAKTILGAPGAIAGVLGGTSSDTFQATEEEKQRQQQMQQLNEQRGKLSGQAQDYRKNLGSTQDKQFVAAQDPARVALAKRMSDVDTAANSRGLLYSGIRQGAQADVAGNYASELSGKRAQINAETQNKADQMDQAAINAGLDAQENQQGIYDDQYNREVKARDAKMGVIKKIGGAAGGLLGSAG